MHDKLFIVAYLSTLSSQVIYKPRRRRPVRYKRFSSVPKCSEVYGKTEAAFGVRLLLLALLLIVRKE